MKNRTITFLATGAGLGLSPIMPGTVGTLWGIPIAWGIMNLSSVWWQVAICLLLTIISIPICGAAEKIIGGKDPGCIVADEYLTLPIVVIGLTNPWALLSGFVFHRIFDITKPPPIKQLEKIQGGFGITIDDVLAALIALACNHILFWVIP